MGDTDSLDAVQPMKAGWYIYMSTLTDQETLLSRGINVAGKYVTLKADARPIQKTSIKIMFKDLPLHSISNEVLDMVKEHCLVTSEVKYANLCHQ